MNDTNDIEEQHEGGLLGPWTLGVGPVTGLATALVLHARAWVPYRELGPCHVEYSNLNWWGLLGCIGGGRIAGLFLFQFACVKGRARLGLVVGSLVMFIRRVLSLAGHSHTTERWSCSPPSSLAYPTF